MAALADSDKIIRLLRGSGRIEFIDELDEHVSELRVVHLGLGADDFDRFAVAVRRLLVFAPGLMHHSEAIPAVMHVGKAFKEISSEGLGLFEPAGSHEVGGGIGRGYQFLEFLVQRALFGQLCATGFRSLLTSGLLLGNHLPLGFVVLRLAALLVFLTAATVTGIIASGFGHFGQYLNRGALSCTQPCWPTPPSTS